MAHSWDCPRLHLQQPCSGTPKMGLYGGSSLGVPNPAKAPETQFSPVSAAMLGRNHLGTLRKILAELVLVRASVACRGNARCWLWEPPNKKGLGVHRVPQHCRKDQGCCTTALPSAKPRPAAQHSCPQHQCGLCRVTILACETYGAEPTKGWAGQCRARPRAAHLASVKSGFIH